MARNQTGGPVRITTASASRDEDIRTRQRRYLVAMGIRTICFVAAIFVTSIWLRVLFVAGALLLPYVAVVMANAGSSKSDGFALMDGPSGAKELNPGHGSGGGAGRDDL